MTISIRRSPRASRLLLRTAVEHGTAGGAEVATVMGHARPDTANVRDVLLAEPDRVRFAGRALPRGPFLRGGGPRPEREREAQERRSGYDRPEVWLGGTNVHYRSSIWLSWYLLLKRRPRQAASPCSRRWSASPIEPRNDIRASSRFRSSPIPRNRPPSRDGSGRSRIVHLDRLASRRPSCAQSRWSCAKCGAVKPPPWPNSA